MNTTRHLTAAGLIERIEHTDGYTEWTLDGEEIAVDTAADLLSREATEESK